MAKIAKDTGPSDARQPEEPLHLRQPEVVPGSSPESAQEATRAAVVGSPDSELSDVQPQEEVDEEDLDLGPDDEGDDEDDSDDPDSLAEATGLEDQNDPNTVEDPEGLLVDSNVVRTEPPTPAYDPGEHTVSEVGVQLDKLLAEDSDESATEFYRIVDAERAGKNRTGITSRG